LPETAASLIFSQSFATLCPPHSEEMSPIKISIKPDPEFGRLAKVPARVGEPERVPFFELLSNLEKEALQALGRDRNSVASYVPLENYLAMLDEGYRIGKY